MDTHVVIMAGGIGSRFWPMSTPECPKQFVDVAGTGRTLIQMTVDRFRTVCPDENIWVVTGEVYVDKVREQLPSIHDDHILAEPVGRGTAPCIAYACWKIALKHPDAVVVFTPADAFVNDVDEFRCVMRSALEFTSSGRRIVTVGIRPSRPETGYGYIECGAAAGNPSGMQVFKVDSFREKPSLEVAVEYVADKRYLWNAGIFVWSIPTVMSEIRTYAPELASQMDMMSASFYSDAEREIVARCFPQCSKISIDYAVMEKSECIYTLPADFGWSDLGTWGSLLALLPKDENGNALVACKEDGVRLIDCRGCIVHVPGAEKVVVQGLSDCIVAQHEGRLLVCRLDHEQKITDYSKDI